MNHFFYQISIGVEPTLGYSSFLFISSSLFILVFLVYFIPISHLVGLTTTSGLDTWSPSNWAYYLKTKGRESLFFAITLDEFDRANALLNEILTITPLNLKLSQAQTALYMKYEKEDLALDSVSTTIALALQTGASRLALDTYLALDSLRLKLT